MALRWTPAPTARRGFTWRRRTITTRWCSTSCCRSWMGWRCCNGSASRQAHARPAAHRQGHGRRPRARARTGRGRLPGQAVRAGGTAGSRQGAVPPRLREQGDAVAGRRPGIDTAARKVSRAGRAITLQPREYALLEYLARRCGQIVTRTEIEEHIYGGEVEPASNAVDSAICSLRQKLGERSSAPLIHTRRGTGLRAGRGMKTIRRTTHAETAAHRGPAPRRGRRRRLSLCPRRVAGPVRCGAPRQSPGHRHLDRAKGQTARKSIFPTSTCAALKRAEPTSSSCGTPKAGRWSARARCGDGHLPLRHGTLESPVFWNLTCPRAGRVARWASSSGPQNSDEQAGEEFASGRDPGCGLRPP